MLIMFDCPYHKEKQYGVVYLKNINMHFNLLVFHSSLRLNLSRVISQAVDYWALRMKIVVHLLHF